MHVLILKIRNVVDPRYACMLVVFVNVSKVMPTQPLVQSGSLCVTFQEQMQPTEVHLGVIEMICSHISHCLIEENIHRYSSKELFETCE